MHTNYPYRATPMKPIDPRGKGHSGEISVDVSMNVPTRPADKPSKIGPAGQQIQTLFGGSKKA